MFNVEDLNERETKEKSPVAGGAEVKNVVDQVAQLDSLTDQSIPSGNEHVAKRKEKATRKLLGTLSKIVPKGLKPYLYKGLEKSQSLESQYIEVLDAHTQGNEIADLFHVYLLQLMDSHSSGMDRDELQSVHINLLKKIVHIIQVIDDPELLIRIVERNIAYFDWNQELLDDEAKILREQAVSVFTKQVFHGLPREQQKKLLIRAGKNYGVAIAELVGELDQSDASEVVEKIIDISKLDLKDNFGYFCDLISALPEELRFPLVSKLAMKLGLAKVNKQSEFFYLYNDLLSLLSKPARKDFIKELFSSWYAPEISPENPRAYLEQISHITDDYQERLLIFWGSAINNDYEDNEWFSLDNAITDAYEEAKKRDQLIGKWAKDGRISREKSEFFGQKLINEQFATGQPNIQAVINIAEKYGVDLSNFQEQFKEYLLKRLGLGQINIRLSELAENFEALKVETEWESYSLDMQASVEYGEKTWRQEQSLVDMLQNHLDANDYKILSDLARELYYAGDRYAFIHSHDLNNLDKFIKRWPYDPQNFGAPYLSGPYAGKPQELAEQIKHKETLKVPDVELLVIRSGDRLWMNYENADTLGDDDEVIGVRFKDEGLGYDKGLNALFAPTKAGLKFQRGRFGQGAKMSMISLLRQNCDISIHSLALDEQTGELVEWHGGPSISDDTETVLFKGKQRRIFDNTGSASTGTVTEIIFENADDDLKEVLQSMLSKRNGKDGLGDYVLEYSRYKDSYIYGSLQTNTQVSVISKLANKIYVQGLEVPAKSQRDFAFSYNFASGNVLTGRDRTYLEVDEINREIAYLWGGVTDEESLRAMYSVILGFRTGASFTFEAIELPKDLVWQIQDNALESHKAAIEKLFGINPDDSLVLYSNADFDKNKNAKEKLESAGYKHTYQVPQFSSEERVLLGKILGEDRILEFSDVWKKINGLDSKDKAEVSDGIKNEVESLANDSKREVISILQENNYDQEAAFLENIIVEINFTAVGDFTGDRKVYTSKISRKNKTTDKWEEVGHAFNIYPELLFGDQEYPSSLPNKEKNYLAHFIKTQLLLIASQKEKSYIREQPGSQYVFGQDLANQLLGKSWSKRSDNIANYPSLEEREPPPVKYASAADQIEQDRKVLYTVELLEQLDKLLSLDEVKDAVGEVNEIVTADESISNLLADLFNSQKLKDKRFSGESSFWKMKIVEANGSRQIELYEIEKKAIGELDGKPAYLVEEESSDVMARTQVIVPFAFTNGELARISIGGKESLLSKYAKRPTKLDNDAHSDPESFFTQESNGLSYTDKNIWYENGYIVFPIGSYTERTVRRRQEALLNTLEVKVSFVEGKMEEERSTGADFIETTATTEYGQGKVWDDPIRIFGDILQNHLDAGEVTIRYRLMGVEKLLTEAELLSDQYKNKEITGIQFEDNGKGFTTRGLTQWGESTKKEGGKRGRYGEGLKMLSVACARSKILLQLESRSWQAAVSTRPRKLIAHGSSKQVDVVGFDLNWGDEREGSKTEIAIDEDASSRTQELWDTWLEVLDPRKKPDKAGNRGINRFVREVRTSEAETIKVGPVTFLPGEGGKIFERGLLVPGAAERMGKKFLFGIDIDGDIIATQERNVVDADIFNAYIEEAIKNAPYRLCLLLMENIAAALRFKQLSIAGTEENDIDEIGTLLDANAGKETYAEFTLLHKVENDRKLRLAYHEVFGEHALLSSAAGARESLLSPQRYNSVTNKMESISEKDQAFYNGVIYYEEHNIPEDSLIYLSRVSKGLERRLQSEVRSTESVFKTFFENHVDLSEQEQEQIKKFVGEVASLLLENLKTLTATPEGQDLLEELYNDPNRIDTDFGKLQLEDTGIEYAMGFLAFLASDFLTINPTVIAGLKGAEAFVHGPLNIAFSDHLFEDPGKLIATTMHELLHLAFLTTDYNQTFYSLLLLANPDISEKLTA